MSEDTLKIEDLEPSEEYPSEETTEDTSEITEDTSETSTSATEYYTDEEFAQLLKNPVHMDVNKISPTQMPAFQAVLEAYKSMQADYTRKTQSIAEQRRQLEAARPRNIYEAYLQDPDGVTTYLNEEIKKKVADADYENAFNLQNLKADLISYRQRILEGSLTSNQFVSNVWAEVRTEIPDFDSKAKKLTDFAINELGLTREEVLFYSDPARTGDLAKKLTLAVNRLYDRLYAGKSAEAKIKKATPPQLTRPGSAGEGGKGKLQAEAAFKKAKEEGTLDAWTKYLILKEVK